MLLGIGVMLDEKDGPNVAKHYGLDTGTKVYFSSAAHNTTMINNFFMLNHYVDSLNKKNNKI